MEQQYIAVNWNELEDEYSLAFWNQNTEQFWLEKEIDLTPDMQSWTTLTEDEKEVFKKALGGLTLLDTQQGAIGMPNIAMKVPKHQSKAVLMFMGAMEEIHAKSYSTIFTTIETKPKIDEIFEWVNNHPLLQQKTDIVVGYYNDISDKKSLYMAMVASVFLESFLFYSGFYYPLYLSGTGRMKSSGEIISLIIRR